MSAHSTPNESAASMWRLPTVLRESCLNKTRLYSLQRAGKFPRGVKISERAVAWPASEVREWISDRIAERDAKPSGRPDGQNGAGGAP